MNVLILFVLFGVLAAFGASLCELGASPIKQKIGPVMFWVFATLCAYVFFFAL